MKIRRFAVATVFAAAGVAGTVPAQANDWVGSALGAVVGGVIGNQFGSGSGNVAATALGAAIGSRVGGDISRGVPSYGGYGYSGAYGRGGYGYPAPVGYEPAYYRPAPPAYGHRRHYDARTVYAPPPPVLVPDACAGELYYDGRYDPDLARAYCRGRQAYLQGQRERELADARSRGLAGQ